MTRPGPAAAYRRHHHRATAFFGRALVGLGALGVGFAPASATAASNDGNVEWDGVYSDSTHRSPRHPGRDEAFAVELRVFRGDLTGAAVRTWDGAEGRVDMVWVRNTGPGDRYDIWRAVVPGTGADFIYYRFELTDGGDTDYFNRLGMSGGEPSSGDFLVNTTELGHFPLGSTPDASGTGTVFRVWAPNADAVSVAGSFNDWDAGAAPLARVQGFWQGRVEAARPGDRYKFAIENGGTHWRTDPRARRQTNSVGDSVIWSSDYVWGDGDWVTPFFEDMVVYELHVGSFSGEDDGVEHQPGRFRDVVDHHLEDLFDLGINVVELMPVTEFAGSQSWGYNPSFLFAPEESYGSPDDLKYLVDRCHQAGIAVVLDVVFNHLGATDLAGNLLDYDGEEIYFYPEGNGFRETPWGPRPDYGRAEVRAHLVDSVRYWMEEYHIDGFRLDGTDFVKVNAEGWRLLQEIAEAADTISPKAIVMAEQLPNDPAVSVPVAEGGAGADAQWNDLFHDGLRDALGAAAFGDPDMGRVVDGMNHFAFGGARAVNYIESHDEVAVHGRVIGVADGGDPHSVWAYGRGKLCYGLVMFTAGIPMVLQGQETMEDRRFGDTADHRIQWDYKRAENYRDYYLACREMTWLRRRLPALRAAANQNIFHLNEGDNVVAWHRWTGSGDDLVVVANFNNGDFDSYCLGMPRDGDWHEVFNSDAAIYGGGNRGNGGRITANGGGRDGLPASACITLPRMGVLVFAQGPIDGIDADSDGDALSNLEEVRHRTDPANPDSDGDGLTDGAEVAGDNPGGYPSDPRRADTDGDGRTDAAEAAAGSDPADRGSFFRVHRVARGPGGLTFAWPSAPGITYRVEVTSDLAGGAWQPLGTIGAAAGGARETEFTDPALPPAGTGRFYRVSVVAP